MTNNISKGTITGTLKMKIGEWKYITSETFCASFANENLLWTSIDTKIMQINPNSGLLYACGIGTTTVFATDINGSTVKVYCSVEVEATEEYLKSQKVSPQTSSTTSTRCGYGNISALGYSGTVYEYEVSGNRVTLHKGFGAKIGTSNFESECFRASLVKMSNIYANMTPQQREAWLKLQLRDFINFIGIFNPQSVTETALNLAKEILSGYGIDLGGQLEATILGIYDWYLEEEDAIYYFNAF